MHSVSSIPEALYIRGLSRPSYLRDETLVDIFRETASRVPEKIALTLIGRGESLTYRELDRRSDLVAAALAARGVRPGDYVGLWFRRSLDLHVALLAILKAGAAYLPFDAEAPAERVASCLVDCGARLLVSHQALATETAGLDIPVASIETLLASDPVDGALQGPESRFARLRDLHIGIHRQAQGHRHHPSKHLPLLAGRQRGVGISGKPTWCCSRLRSPSISRSRRSSCPTSSAPR